MTSAKSVQIAITPADFSVFLANRLVAYLWEKKLPFEMANSLVFSFGTIQFFSQLEQPILQKLAEQSHDLDTFKFKLQLEGFQVLEGQTQPTGHHRRF